MLCYTTIILYYSQSTVSLACYAMLYYYTTHRTILLSVNDQKKKDRPPVELNLTHHTLSLFYPTPLKERKYPSIRLIAGWGGAPIVASQPFETWRAHMGHATRTHAGSSVHHARSGHCRRRPPHFARPTPAFLIANYIQRGT